MNANFLKKNILYVNIIVVLCCAIILNNNIPDSIWIWYHTYIKSNVATYLIIYVFLFLISFIIPLTLLRVQNINFLKSPKLSLFLSVLLICSLLFVIAKLDWTFYHKWDPIKTRIYMGDFTTSALALIPLAAIIIYSNLCNTLKSYVDKLCIFSLAFLCLYISYHLIFNDFHRYNENALNFQIIIHPIVQTFFGKGIWINQMSQYGGYPYFFEPILKVIG